ncbi:hypothetical protein CAOG_000224, partial [Capsaspora owczarzaki ATCC 30864]
MVRNDYDDYFEDRFAPPASTSALDDFEDDELVNPDVEDDSGLVNATRTYPNAPRQRDYSQLSIWRNPRLRKHWRTVAAALFLVFAGFVLLILGLVAEVSGSLGADGYIFFIIGGVCLLPGAFQCYRLYNAALGR